MTGDCCVSEYLRRSVDGKHLMGFQSETSVFKFHRCGVEVPENNCILEVYFACSIFFLPRYRVWEHFCFIPGVNVLQCYHGVVFVLLLQSFQERYSLGGLRLLPLECLQSERLRNLA